MGAIAPPFDPPVRWEAEESVPIHYVADVYFYPYLLPRYE